VLAQWAGGIGHVPPCSADDALRVACMWLCRMDVGDDFGRAAAECLPFVTGGFKKLKVSLGMYGCERFEPEFLRRTNLYSAAIEGSAESFGAFRLFGAGLKLAFYKKELRVVLLLIGVKDRFHESSLRNKLPLRAVGVTGCYRHLTDPFEQALALSALEFPVDQVFQKFGRGDFVILSHFQHELLHFGGDSKLYFLGFFLY